MDGLGVPVGDEFPGVVVEDIGDGLLGEGEAGGTQFAVVGVGADEYLFGSGVEELEDDAAGEPVRERWKLATLNCRYIPFHRRSMRSEKCVAKPR